MTNIQGDNIILSTAAFCLWNISVQEKLEYCHQLGFNNVQIALSTIKMLETFKLSLDNILQIRKFNNVSIHAPWCGIKYGDNIKTTQILDSLRSINQCTPVSRYVFNYDSILNADALYNTGLKIMIRNPAKPDYWHKFRSAIKENKLSCVFDVNKAARNVYPHRYYDR